MKLVAGSRGSRLALKQVDIVASKLRGVNPPVNVETLIVKTAGDVFRDRPITSIDQKGVFSKAIDEAVLRGEADFAVHSMKDLPNELPHGTSICAIPERASPFEVLVSVNYGSLDELPPGAVVGTSSPRRTAQILHVRGEVEVKLIRGNVDTRLRKLEEGQIWDPHSLLGPLKPPPGAVPQRSLRRYRISSRYPDLLSLTLGR